MRETNSESKFSGGIVLVLFICLQAYNFFFFSKLIISDFHQEGLSTRCTVPYTGRTEEDRLNPGKIRVNNPHARIKQAACVTVQEEYIQFK